MTAPATQPDAVDAYHGTDLTDSFVHALAANGVKLFIHKASQGASYRDPAFTERIGRVATYNASGEGRIEGGAYHGLNADPVSSQLQNFVGSIRGIGPVVPVLDAEKLGTDAPPTAAILKAAISGFYSLTGHHPVLYGSDVLVQLLTQLDAVDYAGCLRFGADYSQAPSYPCDLWQYDQYGTLDGVGSEPNTLDLSVLMRPTSLQALLAYQVDLR